MGLLESERYRKGLRYVSHPKKQKTTFKVVKYHFNDMKKVEKERVSSLIEKLKNKG